MKIRALVFDLAGVLLDFGGPESVYRMSDRRVGEKEFSPLLVGSEMRARPALRPVHAGGVRAPRGP